MRIFDFEEAREPLTFENHPNYWLGSDKRGDRQKITQAQETLKEIVGANPQDQLLLYMHKKYATKELFKAILKQKIEESGKIQILISKDLDPFVQEAIDDLSMQGCMKIVLATNELGQIDVEKIKELITFKTCLLSCSYVNPNTGIIEPILEIANLCKQENILLHVDADEALGPLFMDFKTIGCDVLTLNCNTFFAPLGSSLIAIKDKCLEKISYPPIGASLIFNTAYAIKKFYEQSKECFLEIARQRRILESRMSEELEARILFQNTQRSSSLSLIQIPNINHESLSFMLSKKQILTGFDHNLNCLKLHFRLDTSYEDFEILTTAIIELSNKLRKIGERETSAV